MITTLMAWMGQAGRLLGQLSTPGQGSAPGAGNGGGAAPGSSSPAPGGGGSQIFLFMIPMLVLLFLFTIMGGRKEKKRKAALLASIKKQDKVQTYAGIVGTIVEIRDEDVLLRVDEGTNTRIRFNKSAIQAVLRSGREETAPSGAVVESGA